MKWMKFLLLFCLVWISYGCISIESFQSQVFEQDPPLAEWHNRMDTLLSELGFGKCSFGGRVRDGVFEVEMGFSRMDLYLDVPTMRTLIIALEREMIRIGNDIPEIRERCGGDVGSENCEIWIHVHKITDEIPGRQVTNTAVLSVKALLCFRAHIAEPYSSRVFRATRQELEASGPYPSLDEAWERVLACSAELKPTWEAQCAQAEKVAGGG
jgi:hypothetical protein